MYHYDYFNLDTHDIIDIGTSKIINKGHYDTYDTGSHTQHHDMDAPCYECMHQHTTARSHS